MAKSYSEARKQHGESELLDEITSAKPQTDHTRYHSERELKQGGLQHIRAAIQVLDAKATPEEVEDYKQFVLHLADNVASAHREGVVAESPAEKSAIDCPGRFGRLRAHQVLCAARASSRAATAESYSTRNAGSFAAASSRSRGMTQSMRTGLCAVSRHAS